MILAIDTATRWIGVALYDGRTIPAEHGWYAANRHTQELAPAVADMLAATETTPADLTGIAVAIGPGSYTGLRIGLGLAKGFALTNGTPLAGIPTLDITAAGVPVRDGRLCAIAPAGRKRILAAVYTAEHNQWMAPREPTITTWDELIAAAAEHDQPTLFAGELTPDARRKIAAHGGQLTAADPIVCVRRAGHLAALGHERIIHGRADDARSLAPNYLRKPQGS